jgi:O-antigen/teichoic acid export membrane protein
MTIPSLILKAAVAAIFRAASVLVAFTLTVIMTRVLGANEAGLFLLGFTLLTAMASFLRLGLDNILLRVVGSEGISHVAQRTINIALRWVVFSTIPVALIAGFFSTKLAGDVFGKSEFSGVLFWMMLALPSVAVFNLLSFAFQGQQRVVFATLFQNLAQGIIFILLFICFYWFFPEVMTASLAAELYAIASVMVLFLALWGWYRQPQVVFSISSLFCAQDISIWRSSSRLWVSESMSLAVQWSGVLVAGIFISSSDLAYLSAAQRTASISAFVLIVVNMTVAPRYARLWKDEKIDEMKNLAHISTRVMIGLMIPVVAIFLLFPEYIMELFGEGFSSGALLLSIMALGQFVNVATGSVGYLLNMSGHERDMRNVMLISGPFTIVLSILLTWGYGAVGAASATALGVALQNLMALWMVRRRLGFWSLG